MLDCPMAFNNGGSVGATKKEGTHHLTFWRATSAALVLRHIRHRGSSISVSRAPRNPVVVHLNLPHHGPPLLERTCSVVAYDFVTANLRVGGRPSFTNLFMAR